MGLGSEGLSWSAVLRGVGGLSVETVVAGFSASLPQGERTLCLAVGSQVRGGWRPCREEEPGCPGRRVPRTDEAMKMR